jgi:hypothetical protein
VKNSGELWRIVLDFTGVYAITLASESVIQSDSDIIKSAKKSKRNSASESASERVENEYLVSS